MPLQRPPFQGPVRTPAASCGVLPKPQTLNPKPFKHKPSLRDWVAQGAASYSHSLLRGLGIRKCTYRAVLGTPCTYPILYKPYLYPDPERISTGEPPNHPLVSNHVVMVTFVGLIFFDPSRGSGYRPDPT